MEKVSRKKLIKLEGFQNVTHKSIGDKLNSLEKMRGFFEFGKSN